MEKIEQKRTFEISGIPIPRDSKGNKKFVRETESLDYSVRLSKAKLRETTFNCQ